MPLSVLRNHVQEQIRKQHDDVVSFVAFDSWSEIKGKMVKSVRGMKGKENGRRSGKEQVSDKDKYSNTNSTRERRRRGRLRRRRRMINNTIQGRDCLLGEKVRRETKGWKRKEFSPPFFNVLFPPMEWECFFFIYFLFFLDDFWQSFWKLFGNFDSKRKGISSSDRIAESWITFRLFGRLGGFF